MKVLNLVPYNAEAPGRLVSELRDNRQKVILKIFEEIHRNAMVMGINVDAESAKINAVESIEYIRKNYPNAHIEDICQAMKMGAYGQIKFEGQLTTLSASNIFRWYKIFQSEHQDKMFAPPPALALPPPTITDDMKKEVIRQSFINFITDPVQYELIIPMHFDKLIEMKVLNLSDDDKRNAFLHELSKYVNNPPVNMMLDKQSREKVRAYQRYFDQLEDKKNFNYAMWNDHPLHKMILFGTKKRIAIEFLKNANKEELIRKFDETYG